MALIKGTKDNYTHVEFTTKSGTHWYSKELFEYLKWKNSIIEIKYFIVNNE